MDHTQNVLDKNRKTESLQKSGILDLRIQKRISPTYVVQNNK